MNRFPLLLFFLFLTFPAMTRAAAAPEIHSGVSVFFLADESWPEEEWPEDAVVQEEETSGRGLKKGPALAMGMVGGVVGRGVGFLDYDLDGQLDLLVANGSTFPLEDDPTRLTAMPMQLFWNRGTRQGFFEVAQGVEPMHPAVARGLAVADYDADGDEDAFVVVNGGRGRLLRNEPVGTTPGTFHWLQVRLDATAAQRSLAHVRIVYGDRRQRRPAGVSSSYYSQHSDRRHFGLGSVAGVDSVIVNWSDESITILLDVAADQILSIQPPATESDPQSTQRTPSVRPQ